MRANAKNKALSKVHYLCTPPSWIRRTDGRWWTYLARPHLLLQELVRVSSQLALGFTIPGFCLCSSTSQPCITDLIESNKRTEVEKKVVDDNSDGSQIGKQAWPKDGTRKCQNFFNWFEIGKRTNATKMIFRLDFLLWGASRPGFLASQWWNVGVQTVATPMKLGGASDAMIVEGDGVIRVNP